MLKKLAIITLHIRQFVGWSYRYKIQKYIYKDVCLYNLKMPRYVSEMPHILWLKGPQDSNILYCNMPTLTIALKLAWDKVAKMPPNVFLISYLDIK